MARIAVSTEVPPKMKLSRQIGRSLGRFRSMSALLVLFVVLNSVLWSTPIATEAAGAAPPDLAAMALTPADLSDAGLDDYTLLNSGAARSDGDLAFQVGNWMDETGYVDLVAEQLEMAELQRTYPFALVLRDPNDSRFSLRGVYASLNEFDDDDGAASTLDLFVEISAESTLVERIDTDDEIGDEMLLVRDVETHELVLTVRVDRILAFVKLRDYDEDNLPAVDDLLAVADQLLERIEDGLDGDAPGLANHTLRLADDEYHQLYEIRFDQYARLADEDFRYFSDSDDEFSARVEATGNAVDVYQFSQFMQGVDSVDSALPYQMAWSSNLYLFADEDAAAAWFQDRSERLDTVLPRNEDIDVVDIKVIEDAPDIGDESFTVVYTEDDGSGCGCTSQVVRVHARLGPVVADMYLSTMAEEIPIDAIVHLAALQVDCLAGSDCLEPILLSDALAGRASSARDSARRDHAAPWIIDNIALLPGRS